MPKSHVIKIAYKTLVLLTGHFIFLYVQIMRSIPLHESIRAELESQIISGVLMPGARLPTEAELQREHSVSRATAQKALNDLAQAGLVVRRRRRGTHVAEGVRQLNILSVLDPRHQTGEITGRHEIISAAVVPAAQAEVDVPGLGEHEPVVHLVRLKYDVADQPIIVEISAIPFELASDLLDHDLVHLTVRAYFADKKIAIARTRLSIDPVSLEQRHAELLQLEPGVPALRRRRFMWRPGDKLAESAAYYTRPDAIEFFVEHTNPGI